MKIVINRCFGGFGLSYAGVMKYAKLANLKLNAYVDKRNPDGRLDFRKVERYDGKSDPILIYYSTAQLKPDGTLLDTGYFSESDIPRDDVNLIAVVEKLGNKASGKYAALKIVEIPDGVEWQLEEYDGLEHITEKHRTWGK